MAPLIVRIIATKTEKASAKLSNVQKETSDVMETSVCQNRGAVTRRGTARIIPMKRTANRRLPNALRKRSCAIPRKPASTKISAAMEEKTVPMEKTSGPARREPPADRTNSLVPTEGVWHCG